MLFSVEKAYIHSFFTTKEHSFILLKGLLDLLLSFPPSFPFLQEFSCSCLTDHLVEHPNRFHYLLL